MKVKRINYPWIFIAALVTILFAFSGCEALLQPTVDRTGKFAITFLDVGQGDSTLLQWDDEAVLIDGGNPGDGPELVSDLRSLGVKDLGLVVATHPHADHIGGLKEVIEGFDVGLFWAPDAYSTSSTFSKLLDAIEKKGLALTVPSTGETFSMAPEGPSLKVLYPGASQPNDMNLASLIIKAEFEGQGVILTGDAEKESEEALLESVQDTSGLEATLLKAGHHGSHTSSSEAFLKAVKPSYAVISCGKDNDYGHPHKEILERFSNMGVTVWRTDLNGRITALINASGIAIVGSSGSPSSPKGSPGTDTGETKAETSQATISEGFIGNKNSKIYHTADCGSLPTEKNQVALPSKKAAEDEGYSPHSACVK